MSLRKWHSRKCYSLKPEHAEAVKQSELGKKYINELKDLTPEAQQAIGETKQPITENVKNALDTLKKLHFLEIVALCMNFIFSLFCVVSCHVSVVLFLIC
jgi:hypothetical protein